MYDNFKTLNYPKALASPELFGRPLSRIFSGDVIDGLTVAPATGLNVTLAPGNALIRYGSGANASARQVSLVAPFDLAIETPDASNPRIDLVVLYIDNAVDLPSGTPTSANLDGKGVAKAKIVKGSANANPFTPNAAAIQTAVGPSNPYTVLYEIRVDQGVSVIAANKLTDRRTLAKLTQDRIEYAHGVLTFNDPGQGEVNSGGTRNINYNKLSLASKNVTMLPNGRMRLDIAGVYLVVANLHVIDVVTGAIQQILYSTDNGNFFNETGWTARTTPDTNSRTYPAKVVQRYFPAGTILQHFIDSPNSRFGGFGDYGEQTSLSATRIA